jgi:alpha-L-rhamnosidase
MTRTWTATMIAPDDDFGGAPLLRREVALDAGHGDVTSATLHVSACGVYEVSVGGRPVSCDVLSPGWSSYEWRQRYRCYDVTPLASDRFVIGIALGNGWYRGRLGWGGRRALHGDELGAIAELEISFSDGHVQRVVTDGTWRGAAAVAIRIVGHRVPVR